MRHRQRRREFLHDLLGGKCVVCGYCKTNRALEFHHVEPDEKIFQLSREGLSYSLKRVTAETMKCVILCANCHREEQDGLIDKAILSEILESDVGRRTEFLRRRAETIIEGSSKPYCACGAAKVRSANSCKACATKAREKITWPDVDELQQMVAKSNYTQVARELGVSDNAIRKRIKRY